MSDNCYNFDSPGAFQVANQDASPFKNAPDIYYPSDFRDMRGDATAPTHGAMLVRLGWIVKLSSGADLACARVCGNFEIVVP